MAAVVERYIGIQITRSSSDDGDTEAADAGGIVTDMQASWNTPAQVWINKLSDQDSCYVYFAETQGQVSFYNWAPSSGTVEMQVSKLFQTDDAVDLTVMQSGVPIITIYGCFGLKGAEGKGARTISTKAIGGRLIFTGGHYYSILHVGS